MEVKPGYIYTDVGVIPDNWLLMTYGDVFNFLSSATYSRSELTEGDDVKYVHYGDIHTKWDGYLDFSKEYLPTLESEKAKAYHRIEEGDIIIADASEDYEGVGKSVEVKNIGKIKAISGLHTFLLRDKNDIFVNGFRGYIHCNEIVRKQFYRYATGLKVYGISKNGLKSIQIPVPSKAEQTAIATAISDADELIQSLEKLIAKKRLIKQGAMQELLKPKEGWVVKKLGDVANIIMGQSPSSSNYNVSGDGLPLIQGNADISERKTIIRNYTSQITKKCKAGDIIMSVRAPVGEIAKAVFDACIGRGACSISYHNEYLYHYLISIESDWSIYSTGSTFDSINSYTLRNLVVPLPDEDTQIQIATILNDIDKEVILLEEKLEKNKLIKQGMMQSLLTGKIRLV